MRCQQRLGNLDGPQCRLEAGHGPIDKSLPYDGHKFWETGQDRPNASGSVIYGLRRDRVSPYVQAIGEEVRIVADENFFGLTLSRKDARLLAKRINQCLDATTRSKQ